MSVGDCQLELGIVEKVPIAALRADNSNMLDCQIPIEEVPFQYGTIKLRELENRIWIWV